MSGYRSVGGKQPDDPEFNPLTELRVVRIYPPQWARPARFDGTAPRAVRQDVLNRAGKILRLVHGCVSDYLNDDSLCFADGENFPDRNRLTGEYYVGNLSVVEDGAGAYQVSIRARCLEKSQLSSDESQDYLGLEVRLFCPGIGQPFEFMGADSQSL